MSYVDRERWQREIQQPDWYLHLRDEYLGLLAHARQNPRPIAKAIADEVYGFFESALREHTLALGQSGPDWDAERRAIDTAVIHHTALEPGITIDRIEAIHLTRIYASYYTNPAAKDAAIRGTGMHSGHFRGGRQVFHCYHWLVRDNGTCERMLEDHETGWHAGNWDINCRSIAICLDANLTNATPTPEALAAVRQLLASNYSQVRSTQIFGHREINPRTTCPGNRYLTEWAVDVDPNADATRGGRYM